MLWHDWGMAKIQKPKSVPAIRRLVDHNNGYAETSRRMGGKPAWQEVQRWVDRGWASSLYLLQLEPLMPEGMTLHDLMRDRQIAKAGDALAA